MISEFALPQAILSDLNFQRFVAYWEIADFHSVVCQQSEKAVNFKLDAQKGYKMIALLSVDWSICVFRSPLVGLTF